MFYKQGHTHITLNTCHKQVHAITCTFPGLQIHAWICPSAHIWMLKLPVSAAPGDGVFHDAVPADPPDRQEVPRLDGPGRAKPRSPMWGDCAGLHDLAYPVSGQAPINSAPPPFICCSQFNLPKKNRSGKMKGIDFGEGALLGNFLLCFVFFFPLGLTLWEAGDMKALLFWRPGLPHRAQEINTEAALIL